MTTILVLLCWLTGTLGGQTQTPPVLTATTPAPATPTVTFVVAHQPLEAFRAVFWGQRITGVALYQLVVCNHTSQQVSLGAGMLLEKVHLQYVDYSLAAAIGDRAQSRTKLYKLARVAEWSAWATTIVLAGSAGDVSPAVKLIPPLIAGAAARLVAGQQQHETTFEALAHGFLDPEKKISLDAQGCAARLFLATYDPKFRMTSGVVW